MLDFKKVLDEIGLTAKKGIPVEDKLLLLAIVFVFVIGYVVPVILYPIPTGTDVYTHIFHTEKIKEAGSLDNFYKLCERNDYTSCDYPFGLWLIGASVSTLAGLTVFSVSYVLPLVAFSAVIVLFYFYSGIFIGKRKLRLLSILFMMAMPNIAIVALSYTPATFSIIFILLIFYFTFTDRFSLKIKVFVIEALVICLLVTHTGTYLFLLSFSMTFMIIMAVMWGDFRKDVYILLLSLLLIYAIFMWIFPGIQTQYTDKSTLFLTIGNTMSEATGLDLFNVLSSMFYDRVFVKNGVVDAVLWAALFYVVVETIIILRMEVIKSVPKKALAASIPFIGSINNMSHSVIATPFWVGPLHSLLSIFGAFRLDRKGMGILLACMLVLLLPGGLHEGSTGALREIFYFIVIIPITSALGFDYALEKLSKRKKGRTGKVLLFALLFSVFIAAAATVVIGNLYYRLEITGMEFEREGMMWLGGIGIPEEEVSGYGYRHMMSVYSGKVDPSAVTVPSGSDTRRFINDIKNIHFAENSELASNDIHARFGVDYVIVSEKTMRNLNGNATSLKIGGNPNLDKIYSTKRSFSIYKYRMPEGGKEKEVEFEQKLYFIEESPSANDNGVEYEIESDSYRVVIDKKKPIIKYIGSPDGNYLGEGGYLSDIVVLNWYGGERTGSSEYIDVSGLNYTYSALKGNQIVYEAVARSDNEEWASVIFRYTFHEKIVKKEVIVANDRVVGRDGSEILTSLSTRIFSPFNYFEYSAEGVPKRKTIYPSDDSVKIEEGFEDIFVNNGRTGIYISYGATSSYPTRVIYKGSTIYNYSFVSAEASNFISSGDYMHVTQYMAMGNEYSAKNAVNDYTSVELSPYPHGKTPLVLTGYASSIIRATPYEFQTMLSAFNELKDEGATQYTIGVPMTDYVPGRLDQLTSLNKDVIEYEQMYDRSSGYYYSYNAQIGKLGRAQNILNEYKAHGSIVSMNGFIPEALDYNLDTVKALDEKGVDFMIGTKARAPFWNLNGRGTRYPRYAYNNGTQTGVLMLPVSLPTSSSLRPEYDINDTKWSWMSSIDACGRSREMCLFVWHPEKIGEPEYADIAKDVTRYAKESGLSFFKPQDVAEHMKSLSSIRASVEKDVDAITINITNNGQSTVNYVGLTAILPNIDYECPYNATGVKEVEIRAYHEDCIIRLSVDVQAHGNVQIKIRPSIQRRKIDVVMLGSMEGDVVVSVNDTEGLPVEGAFLTFGRDIYMTDTDGIARVNARGGIYIMEASKAGYETKNTKIEVGSRGFGGVDGSSSAYIFYAVVLVLLAVVYFFRQVIILHAFDKTGKAVKHARKISDKVLRKKPKGRS